MSVVSTVWAGGGERKRERWGIATSGVAVESDSYLMTRMRLFPGHRFIFSPFPWVGIGSWRPRRRRERAEKTI